MQLLCGRKLLISVSNCAGGHPGGDSLDLSQTKTIFDFSHTCGVNTLKKDKKALQRLYEKGYSDGKRITDYLSTGR